MPMDNLLKIFILYLVAYLNLSCWCPPLELSKEFVKKADLIFEGELIRVNRILEDKSERDLKLTFKPIKVYKGKIQNSISLRSSESSCGFMTDFARRQNYIGVTYLIYSVKINGQHGYDVCTDRRIRKTPKNWDFGYDYTSDKWYKKELVKLDSIYNMETTKLDSLLKITSN